jgi:hypothetical protein
MRKLCTDRDRLPTVSAPWGNSHLKTLRACGPLSSDELKAARSHLNQ